MSKHTPGPWQASVTGTHVRATDGRSVAITHDRSTEDAANARLIAAAPDLLEALECVAAWGEGAKLTAGNIRMVREAIAKATGGDK